MCEISSDILQWFWLISDKLNRNVSAFCGWAALTYIWNEMIWAAYRDNLFPFTTPHKSNHPLSSQLSSRILQMQKSVPSVYKKVHITLLHLFCLCDCSCACEKVICICVHDLHV